MTRKLLALYVLGTAVSAHAGAVVELVPDQAGPFSPGQTVSVDVWLHNEGSFDIDLRLVILDFESARERLFAGGDFVTSNGVTANYVAKLSGDSWTAVDTGLESPVNALKRCTFGGATALYAGGTVYVGYGAEGMVSRLEAGRWSEVGDFGRIQSLLCDDDGVENQLYAAGFIWQPSTQTYGIAAWNGSEWNPIIPGLHGTVRTMVIFDDGTGPTLYAGGSISFLASSCRPSVLLWRIAQWTGTTWVTLGGGIGNGYGSPAGVNALTVFNDGTGPALYAAGDFRDVQLPGLSGLLQVNNIAKWDGTEWWPVGGGTTPNISAPIFAMAVFDDGTGAALYIGGEFTSVGGVSAKNIARWDGVSWSAVGGGVTGDASAAVHTLAIFDDGSGPALYVGGRFTNAGGVAVSNIAKWNGMNWSAVGAGVDDTVHAFAVHEADGDPNLGIEGNFHFDFSTLSDGGEEYAIWPGLPGPAIVYIGLGPVQGSILNVRAGGSLRLGELDVVMPGTPGTYRLDAARPHGERGGSIVTFGFGGPHDPYTDWLFESGGLAGDPIPFIVQTAHPDNIPAVSTWGMIVLTLLLVAAATVELKQRRPRTAVGTS